MTYKRELAEAIRHVTNVAVWLLEQADQEESRGRGEWSWIRRTAWSAFCAALTKMRKITRGTYARPKAGTQT
jgi:hypothetical protein